jgi:hypothetical protein
MNEKAKFKIALKQYLNTCSFHSVDEFGLHRTESGVCPWHDISVFDFTVVYAYLKCFSCMYLSLWLYDLFHILQSFWPQIHGMCVCVCVCVCGLQDLFLLSKSKLCYYWWSIGQSVLVSGTHLGPNTRFLFLSDGTFSDERLGLQFTIAAEPHQCSHSQVCVLKDSWSCSIVSNLRFPQPGGSGSCKRKLCYDWQSICLGVRHPSKAHDQITITVRQHSHSQVWFAQDSWSYSS